MSGSLNEVELPNATQVSPSNMANDTSPLPKSQQDLQRSYGTNWNRQYINTIYEWISIAAFNIRCLELMASYNRHVLRNTTIFGMLVSTLSGTISATQFSIPSGTLSTVFSAVLTVLTFAVAIAAGYVKVYELQGKLELYIKVKQDWVTFSTTLASELQLPIELRRDALYLIIKHKNTYLDLMKVDWEAPEVVRKQVEAELPNVKKLNMDVSGLSHIILDIGRNEYNRSSNDLLEDLHAPLLRK